MPALSLSYISQSWLMRSIIISQDSYLALLERSEGGLILSFLSAKIG